MTVSCTGIMIPSVDAYLLDELGFRRDVRRLPLTELGCAGGAAALGRAHDFLRGFPTARALVVAVELPSLSLQRSDVSPANLVSTALFGDGAAAVLMEGGGADAARRAAARARDAVARFPRTTGALGFELRRRRLPLGAVEGGARLLKTEIAALSGRLAARRGLGRDDLRSSCCTPGGRKILNVVEEELRLTRDDTQPSWDILRDHGNQSSASVLFVLDKHLADRAPARGARGLLAAFGPGLAVDLLLLEAL